MTRTYYNLPYIIFNKEKKEKENQNRNQTNKQHINTKKILNNQIKQRKKKKDKIDELDKIKDSMY